jgi:transposase
MLGFGAQQQYFIYQGSTDMRKGYYGLSGLVRNELGSDPLSGSVYVFFSKSRQTVKLLMWEGDGFVVYAKRLERGCYEVFNKQISARQSPISYQHLVMLLSGISLVGTRQRKRYKMVAEG